MFDQELNIYLPRGKEDSKCWNVFTPMSMGWRGDVNVEYDYQYQGGVGMFWGLVGKNQEMIQQYIKDQQEWIFTDMAYFHRWSGLAEALDPDEDFYWRIIPGGLHPHNARKVPDDRMKKLGIHVPENRQTGDEVIICPSSEAITQYIYGYGMEEWVDRTKMAIRMNTDRPIRVRYKPRRNGTSGPDVALIPFAEDVKNAWCVVTSASMAGVEAILHGVPTIQTTVHGPWHIFSDIRDIENIKWTPSGYDLIMRWLTYHQYTPKEIYSGACVDMLKNVCYYG